MTSENKCQDIQFVLDLTNIDDMTTRCSRRERTHDEMTNIRQAIVADK